MAKSFRDLKVWQRAIDLTVVIYELSSEFPRHEIYGLSSQMRRASVSIASNVAEGCSRGSDKDFRQFVRIAKGSCSELETQLAIAERLGYAERESIARAQKNADEVGRMLSGLVNHLTTRIRAKITN